MRFVNFLVSLSSKSVKTMTNYMKTIVASLMLATGTQAMAQQVNDSNTPLHLMRPAYKIGYGVSSVDGRRGYQMEADRCRHETEAGWIPFDQL